jgi:hypothetical protein
VRPGRPWFKRALIAPAFTALALAAVPTGAQAATTGTLTGSITVPSGTTVHASDVNVLLSDRNGSPVTVPAADETVTDTGATTASYTVTGLAPGQYYVYFSDTTSTDNVAPDYYGDGGVDDIAKASIITVGAAGGSQTLSPVTLGTGATIAGTVSDANVAAETSARVIAEPTQAGTISDPLLGAVSGTLSGGAYRIGGLPAGTYTLRYAATGASFHLSGAYVAGAGLVYDYGSATQFPVAAASATTASFAVPTLGGIGGTVTDSTNNTVAGDTVFVFDAAGTEISASGTTGVDGTYVVSDVLPGTYEVELGAMVGSNLAATFYGGSTLATATKLTVSSGVETPNINGVLGVGATVSGTVTSAQGGALLGGLDIRLLDGQGRTMDETTTNVNGTYTLSDVPAGSWYLEFVGGRAYNGLYYASEYYLGQATLGGSKATKVVAGQALTGINEALMAQSSVLPGVPRLTVGRLSGLAKRKVALGFRLTAGSGTAGYLQAFTVKLPKAFSWNRGALKRDISIPGDKFTYAIKSGRLVITFATGKKVVNFRIRAGGIRVSKKIQRLAEQRKIASEGIAVAVMDTTGKVNSGAFLVKKPH